MNTRLTPTDIADATPASRNRWVDALRAMSILVVVLGHWLMAGPEMLDDGTIRIGHLVAESRVVQGLTWVFQVMPIFFFVGGFANSASWRSARRSGTPYAEWLRSRLRRLIAPVLPLLAFWAVAAAVTTTAGIDADLVRAGSQAALVPVWFLATYVLTVALAPLTLALWNRFGFALLAVLTGLAALVDVASIGAGVPLVQWVNYLFVWNAVHALGYAWADGRIGSARTRLAIAGGGVATLATLVATLPYPLAMVGLDGAELTNSNPPRVTLVLLALFQFGIVTALEAPARRALERIALWRAVVVVSGVIMTLYLWHLTAMVGVVGAQIALDGFGLRHPVASGAWWATRPLFVALLAVVTAGFVALLARFERPSPAVGGTPQPWRPLLAVALICAGLGSLAANGVVDGPDVSWLPMALTLAGASVGGVLSPTVNEADVVVR